MKAKSNACPLPLSLRAATLALVFGAAQAQTESTLPETRATASGERNNAAASTGAKFETPLRDLPQSISVLDRKMLDTQAAASLKDALRNVPGITLGAGEGGVIGDNINLRGFSARTDVYLDGLRDRGQYARDVFSLQAVEVLKGPSSMLFGRGSTGGVINQISKKPELKDSGEAGLTVGTDDDFRSTLDVNRKLSETSAARVSVFGQDVKSTRDVVRNRDWGVAPSVRLGINTPTDVTLAALIQRNRDLPDYGFPFVTSQGAGTVRRPIRAARNVFFGYDDDHFNQSVNTLSASIQHKFSPTTTLRNRTLLSHNTTEASPSPLGAVVSGALTVPTLSDPLSSLTSTRQDRDRVLRDTSLINQTDLVLRVNAGSTLHTVTTGLEIGHEKNREDRYAWNTTPEQAAVNLGNPLLEDRPGERTLSRTSRTTVDTLAVYVNDQIDLNPQWKLVAGLRGERFKARYSLEKQALPVGFPLDTTLPAENKSETLWSPRAGVLFQPDEAQTYYLSYGTSFNPSAETVSQSASTASLDSEKNRSFEAGTRIDLLGGDVTANAAVFRIEKTNARTSDASGLIQVTEGRIRVEGAEFSLTGRISATWEVFGGYTFLDGKIVKSPQVGGAGADLGIAAQGKAAPNTPRHSATLWSTYRLTPQWELGGGLQYSASRTLNNFGSAEVAGYTRLDATVAYLTKAYELRLNLQNLGDKAYFESASGGRATLARGRTALLSARVRF